MDKLNEALFILRHPVNEKAALRGFSSSSGQPDPSLS
jgi:hypothetical protein